MQQQGKGFVDGGQQAVLQLTPLLTASRDSCHVTDWHEHIAVNVRRKSPHLGSRQLLNLATSYTRHQNWLYCHTTIQASPDH